MFKYSVLMENLRSAKANRSLPLKRPSFPRGRGTLCQGGPHGKHQGLSGGSGSLGQYGQESLLWFLHGGPGETACVGLGLTSLNNLSGFWGTGPLPSCLVPSPESD